MSTVKVAVKDVCRWRSGGGQCVRRDIAQSEPVAPSDDLVASNGDPLCVGGEHDPELAVLTVVADVPLRDQVELRAVVHVPVVQSSGVREALHASKGPDYFLALANVLFAVLEDYPEDAFGIRAKLLGVLEPLVQKEDG